MCSALGRKIPSLVAYVYVHTYMYITCTILDELMYVHVQYSTVRYSTVQPQRMQISRQTIVAPPGRRTNSSPGQSLTQLRFISFYVRITNLWVEKTIDLTLATPLVLPPPRSRPSSLYCTCNVNVHVHTNRNILRLTI